MVLVIVSSSRDILPSTKRPSRTEVPASARLKLHLDAGEEALVWLRRSIEANRNNPLSRFWLADALTRIGELNEAKATAQAALALDPTFTIRRLRATAPSNNPAFLAGRELFYRGLRLAAVPEG